MSYQKDVSSSEREQANVPIGLTRTTGSNYDNKRQVGNIEQKSKKIKKNNQIKFLSKQSGILSDEEDYVEGIAATEDSLFQEIQRKRQRMDFLDNQNQNKDIQISTLQAQIQDLNKQHKQLEKMELEKEETLKDTLHENEKLSSYLNQIQNVLNQSKQYKNNLQGGPRYILEEIQNLMKENVNFKQENEYLKIELQGEKGVIEYLEKERQATEICEGKFQRELNQKNQAMDACKQQQDKLHKQFLELQQKHFQLETEKNNLISLIQDKINGYEPDAKTRIVYQERVSRDPVRQVSLDDFESSIYQ